MEVDSMIKVVLSNIVLVITHQTELEKAIYGDNIKIKLKVEDA